MIPGMGERSAPHLDFAGEVRAATRLPTFHAARIQDVATARHAIESRQARHRRHDARASRRSAYRAEDRTRAARPRSGPASAWAIASTSIYSGQAVCIHNPATGREQTIPHVVYARDGPMKKFVVVGAGPGGLEAARVAGERGHKTSSSWRPPPKPGGQIGSPPRSRAGARSSAIVDWRIANASGYGVDLRYNALCRGRRRAANLRPTWSSSPPAARRMSSFSTRGAEFAVSSWDILSGAARPSGEVIVYDDNGAHAGV